MIIKWTKKNFKKLITLLNYYGIYELLELLKSFLSLRYILRNQIFLGSYTLRNKQYISIGKGFKAYQNFFAEAHEGGKIVIGKSCIFNRNAYLTSFSEIKIGDNCLFGSNVFITDNSHGSYSGFNQSHPSEIPVNRLISTSSIIIEKNVWIGSNVVITKGVSIGKGSVVGSNSVVTKNIPANSIAAGIPAKVIKIYSEEQKKWIQN
tara:strand:- start:10882 stop:11499 length:618 start_codon:yes stop_codon:yes gene_type:complete